MHRLLATALSISLIATACAGPETPASTGPSDSGPPPSSDVAADTSTNVADDRVPPTSPPTPEPTDESVTPATSATRAPTTPTEPSDGTQIGDEPVIDVDSPVLDLLAEVDYPSDGIAAGMVTDFGRLFATVDTSPDELCGDEVAYEEAYLQATDRGKAVVKTPFFTPGSQSEVEALDDIERSFGFSFCDINAIVDTRLPGHYLHVDVDPTAVVSAAEADTRWADILAVEERDDTTVLSWLEDLNFDRELSAMFPYVSRGGGGLGVRGPFVVRSRSLEHLDRALDATRPSVAETGTLATTIALALGEGAYSMQISDQPYAQTPGRDVPIEDGLPLWTSLAIGVGRVDGAARGIVVMAHLSADDATESASRFQTMVEDGTNPIDGERYADTIELLDVRTDGRYLIAHAVTADPDSPIFFSLVTPYLRLSSLYGVGEAPDD